MWIIIVVIGIFLIVCEESNKGVLTPKQHQKLIDMKPLADRDRELWKQVFGNRK